MGPSLGVLSSCAASRSPEVCPNRMIDEPNEARFIERLRARDERAFNELVKIYERRVFGLLLRLIGRRDEAEDLAQEVFVQVFKAISSFRGESKLSTWIFRIAVNLSKNRTKYLARRQPDSQDHFDGIAEEVPHAPRQRRRAGRHRAARRIGTAACSSRPSSSDLSRRWSPSSAKC